MIYLYNLVQFSTDRARVDATHFQPFNEVYGFHKAQVELEQEGIFVEALPEVDSTQNTKTAMLYCNPTTKEIWYEYEERPLSSDEEVAKLKDQQVLMQQAIDDLILGGAL